jgi:VIT1/CCC1 family predicted Fe2+/Mn2+ transporter
MTAVVRGLKIGFAGFVIAAIGAALGFAGFFIEERTLSLVGLAITVAGVAVGFVGLIYGWITEGKRAITGSVQASRDLREKFLPGDKNGGR